MLYVSALDMSLQPTIFQFFSYFFYLEAVCFDLFCHFIDYNIVFNYFEWSDSKLNVRDLQWARKLGAAAAY